jgi:hypothetical protein
MARVLTVLAAAAVAAGSLAVSGAAAHGAPARAAKVPSGESGSLLYAAAVPHSTQEWTVGHVGTGVDNFKYFELHRVNGHWKRVASPKLGGRYGVIDAMAAGSAKSVWLVGGMQQTPGIQEEPVIYGWNGHSFARAKLPALDAGAEAMTSVSASSASNAWAVGDYVALLNGSGVQLSFHWNGHKWLSEPGGPTEVATAGPTSTFGLENQNTLVAWNGSAWATVASAPSGFVLFDLATSGPKLAYAVGQNQTTYPYRSAIMRWNGKTWSSVAVPKAAAHALLRSVTMHGKSVWAVGSRVSAAGHVSQLALHSTGGAWKVQQTLGTGYSLSSVSAASASKAFAVGAYTSRVSGAQRTYIDQGSGSHWKGVASKP